MTELLKLLKLMRLMHANFEFKPCDKYFQTLLLLHLRAKTFLIAVNCFVIEEKRIICIWSVNGPCKEACTFCVIIERILDFLGRRQFTLDCCCNCLAQLPQPSLLLLLEQNTIISLNMQHIWQAHILSGCFFFNRNTIISNRRRGRVYCFVRQLNFFTMSLNILQLQ